MINTTLSSNTRMTSKKYRFEPTDNGTFQKECFEHTTLSELLEDGIIDVRSAKGESHKQKILNELHSSLDAILGTEQPETLQHCKDLLDDPDDAFVIDRIQRSTTNSELKHFLCIHGYHLGIEALCNQKKNH